MPKLKQFRIFYLLLIVTGLAALVLGGPGAQESGSPGVALVVEVEGPIGPATVRYIENAIEEARIQNAEVLILGSIPRAGW